MDGSTQDPALIARCETDPLPAAAPLPPLRVLMASLARGGAERIVLDWLGAEAARGRTVQLAVVHRRASEYGVPRAIGLLRRDGESPEAFADRLAGEWRGMPGPVAAHLVSDALMARLWRAGIRTLPVLHNTRAGWRNAPWTWPAGGVPLAIACANAVRDEALASGCRVPLSVIRHRPRVDSRAGDHGTRQQMRAEWNLAAGDFVIGVVGAFKPQKDHARAVEVLAAMPPAKRARLVILGGTLDAAGLQELDRVAVSAARLGVAHALRLPGWADDVAPWYAAFDALLNVSRHEGLSMATQEALAAGLPVVALEVGGQGEMAHPRLTLLPPTSSTASIAAQLAGLPVRGSITLEPAPRWPRAWSVPMGLRETDSPTLDTLFVTANLNAGGAQRSLVNLACAIHTRQRIAIAVCGTTTQPVFAAELAAHGVRCFRPAADADACAVAEGVLAAATAGGARTLCFWNVAPQVKLLVARFAPESMRLVDASPGGYAYRELDAAAPLGEVLALPSSAYHARLDVWVSKFHDSNHPPARSVRVIPNGVAMRPRAPRPAAPRFLVSGRIAPSKRIEVILDAFRLLLAAFPQATLHVSGQAEVRDAGYLQSLRDQARGLPVAFRGADAKLNCLSEPFTAAVVLGTHQGCPNAVLEAMSAGIPVIANDSGGTREMVRDGDTGWLLPENVGVAALADALRQACDSPRSAALGGNARNLVVRHHGIEAMAAAYLDVLGATSAGPCADAPLEEKKPRCLAGSGSKTS